ncbi:MAG: sporulation integral membrane protein YtvI [Lachnospiraceae bacterium]|nr:sporulation integral membrane protein YtvI [Lachnospiraceae bacterium]
MSQIWKTLEIYVKAILNLIVFGIVTLAIMFLLPRLFIYFMPFVIGAIIAWVASPIIRFLERKLKVRRKFSSAIVIILVIALILALTYLIGVWIFNYIIDFLGEWPLMWVGIQNEVAAMGDKFALVINQLPDEVRITILNIPANLGNYFADMVTAVSVPTFEAVGRFASNLPLIIVNVVMCLLSSYFFIAERDYFANMGKYVPRTISSKFVVIKDSIKQSVGGYIIAQLKIEVWIYPIIAIGFLILKVEYALLIAVGIAFLDFLPIIGTGLVLIPWAIVKLFNGDYFSFAGLLIIQIGSQIIRQIIQPKIMGDTIGVPPIPTLFLLYLGFRLAGIFGMIIALPVGIIIINLYQAGVFESTKRSLRIIIGGLNRFRKIP